MLLLAACSQPINQVRSSSVRAEFQREHPCPANGERRGVCSGYVVDHIKPLCGGGDDSVENMQWQEYGQSILKDKEERALCRTISN